jgi:hypothetical protein
MDNNPVNSTENKNTSETPPTNPAPANQDWHDIRRAAHEARREARRTGWGASSMDWGFEGGVHFLRRSWLIGGILILLGILFLLQNLYGIPVHNWWALFILIPAFGAFNHFWLIYQRDQRLSGPARRSLLSGIFLTLMTAVFMLSVSWSWLFPVALILAGAALLLDYALPK